MGGTRQKRSHICSIQALRGIACILVIISHTGFNCFASVGVWGVSLFFVLSGFMMMYAYYGMHRIERTSIISNIRFAWKKIKSVYLLHLLTTIAMLVFAFVGKVKTPIVQTIIKVFLNALLIQEWIPLQNRSINDVSWYLSAALFCYFIFPWIIKKYEKRNTRKQIVFRIFLLLFIQIIIDFIGGRITHIEYTISNVWTTDMTKWLVYYLPFSRCLEFLIGCNLGIIFINSNSSGKERFSFYEKRMSVIAVILAIFANIIFLLTQPNSMLGQLIGGNSSSRWWTYTLIFLPSSCLFVYVFAHDNSLLAKICSEKLFIYVGGISQYLFLIHFVVFKYLTAVLSLFVNDKMGSYFVGWTKISIGIFFSFLFSQIWKCIIHKHATIKELKEKTFFIITLK